MVDIQQLSKLASAAGKCLTIEERTGLQVAMVERQREENFANKLKFWGKVLGEQNDYLIAYAAIEDNNLEFPIKKYFYLTTGTYVLKQLPDLSPEYIEKAKAIKGRFRGDPSFPLDGEVASPEENEIEEGGEEENIKKESFREIHRLAYTIKLIEHDVTIVPRGAVYLDTQHKVRVNKAYEGLSYTAAENLKSFLHYRRPESNAAKLAFAKDELTLASDFLDSIDNDQPKGIWSRQWDSSKSTIILGSLYWPGHVFYHSINSVDYGSIYWGYGERNLDLSFQL